jgi:hypothetical protein
MAPEVRLREALRYQLRVGIWYTHRAEYGRGELGKRVWNNEPVGRAPAAALHGD